MKISQLLSAIDDKELVIPEFQREYVWSRNQAKELMISLFNDYPTGSILVWDTTTPPEIKNDAVKTEKTGWFKVLLDGQQRLTTLFLLMRGEIPPYYTESDLNHDPRNLYFNLLDGTFEYFQKQKMATSPYWKPVTECFMQDFNAFSLIEGLQIESDQERLTTGRKINDNLNRLRSIQEREYFVQSVPQNADIDKAIDVFDRVNSLGTKLTDAELVLTHIAGKWPRVRREMKVAMEKYRGLGFDFTLDFMTRCVVVVLTKSALYEKMTPEFYEKLDDTGYKTAWARIQKMFDYLLPVLKESAFLSSTAEMNTTNVLVPIIGYLSGHDGVFPSEGMKNHFIHWMYLALVWSRYAGQTDQRLDRDVYLAMTEQQPVEALLSEIEDQRGRLEIKPADLEGHGSRHQAHKLLYVLAKYNKAVDWATGGSLSATMGDYYSIQSHHIFPQALLYRSGYSTENYLHTKRVNELANRAFITRDSNFEITDRDPSEYLPKVMKAYPSALAQQLIPEDIELWKVENYERFLEVRRKSIADALNTFINHFKSHTTEEESKPDYSALITHGEDDYTEFKSSLRWDYATNQVNKVLEHAIAKTICAFMNAEGGRLFIGINDDGQILGLKKDYITVKKKDKDGFLLQLTQVINEYLGKEWHQYVKPRMVLMNVSEVCVVDVRPSDNPVFLSGQEFYIRASASSQSMNMVEASAYIKSHWN
jgi:hypothetical protein